jgi:magnesium transporter
LQLDLLRNRFLKLELVLSFSSIIVAMGALITGVFGMNLLNHFELSRTAFLAVTGSIFAGMLISFISALMYGRRQKLF